MHVALSQPDKPLLSMQCSAAIQAFLIHFYQEHCMRAAGNIQQWPSLCNERNIFIIAAFGRAPHASHCPGTAMSLLNPLTSSACFADLMCSKVCLCCRPDYEACAALAEMTLNSSDCGAAHCVLGAPQPATSGKFIALAGNSSLLQYTCLHCALF